MARGHSYKEIGGRLFIAEKTVENHVRNILGKLHLSRRQELIRYALEHGIDWRPGPGNRGYRRGPAPARFAAQ